MRVIPSVLVCLLLLGATAPGTGALAPVQPEAGAPQDRALPRHSAIDRPAKQADLTGRSARASSAESNIVRHLTLHRTPDEPGSIRATFTYEIPESVTELKVIPDDRATLLSADGFNRQGGNFTWDSVTETPTLTFRLAINETHTGARAISAGSAGYAFVDVGAWAIVRVPRYSTAWRWVGTESVGLVRETSIDGPGATGGQIAYLGEHAAYEATGNGQRFRLIVPAAASMTEEPDAVLSALVSASGMLDVGARDEEVFFVAAPTTVNWGPAGLEYGGSDAWVLANSSLSSASNTWFHEYVHTRQTYRPTTATRWSVEAVAEYYAASLTLRQGHIGFAAYRRLLERGSEEPYATDVLAEPSTWNQGTPYYKGALVFGNVDRLIRVATDGSATAEGLFRRMNRDDGYLTAEEFYAFVEAVSTAEVREYAIKYTQTRAVPEMWSQQTHSRVFTDVPRFTYDTTYRVTGPYRTQSYNVTPTLVPGETLHVTVTIRNVGSAQGRYSVVFRRNGTTRRQTGQLAPDATATVTFEHRFQATGTYAIVYGNREYVGNVTAPAEPRVTQLAVSDDRVPPGEPVRIAVTIGNPELIPANGTVAVRVDDTVLRRWTVRLAGGEIVTREATVSFERTGEHEIRVGNRSATVEVTTAAAAETTATGDGTAATPGGETPAGTAVRVPGFGLVTAVLALGVGLVLLGRR